MSGNQERLASLVESLMTAHVACSHERRRLHEIEWEAGEGGPSVLGEVEVRAGVISGIASLCSGPHSKNPAHLIEVLNQQAIARSEAVADWVSAEGSGFPSFLAYLKALEALRSCLLEILSDQNEGNSAS